MDAQSPLETVIASARNLSAHDQLRLIEVLLQSVKAAVPEERAQAAGAARSPDDVQQARDEIFHDF